MSARLFLCCLLAVAMLHSPTFAQGFAGLGTSQEGYQLPQKGLELQFPRDHGPHPGFRIEWWYLTANLKGEDGVDYGVQWTLFRSATRPGDDGASQGWATPQLWMGHAALTTPDQHFVAERRARGGTGQAGVDAQPFRAWIDDWQMRSGGGAQEAQNLPGLTINASGKDFAFDLNLSTSMPLVLQGDKGYSVKAGSGQASHYYSQPFYAVEGSIRVKNKPVKVTGNAWLDREWSSQPLAADQKGWDWISLHFDSGAKLMGFAVRKSDGTQYTSATWMNPAGTSKAYGDGALTLTPLSQTKTQGATLPTRWRVQLPGQNVDVEITAVNPQSWMTTSVPYWEGPVGIEGSQTGHGYLEMTGY